MASISLQDLIKSFSLTQFQDLEDAFWQMIQYFDIDNSYGVHLDVIGQIVGIKRNDQSDDVYRLLIRAAIARNSSRGTTEELNDTFRIATGSENFELIDSLRRTILAQVPVGEITTDTDLLEVIKLIMEAATAAGVSFLFIIEYDPVDPFRLDVGPGFGTGKLATIII